MTLQANQLSLNLVADVGGTNTRIALAQGVELIEGTIRRYKNAENVSFYGVLEKFLRESGQPILQSVCVAVAGPVEKERATLTNLDWVFENDALMSCTGAKNVAILNDLQAQGHALQRIECSSFRTIVEANSEEPSGTRLMVGVGTGFNSAPVFEFNNELFVAPSETGHASLPVRNQQDYHFSQSISDSHGFPAIEEALSGRGLENIYAVVRGRSPGHEKTPANEIMSLCETEDANALRTVETFTRLLANTCGDLALIQIPVGGIYLVGGVSRAIAPYLKRFSFEEAFRDKGRFSAFMEQFAVHVVEDDYAALIGCAAYTNSKLNTTSGAVV